MFPTPKQGDVVTVTTQYNTEERTYKNVRVLSPFKWLTSNEFCIPVPPKEQFTNHRYTDDTGTRGDNEYTGRILLDKGDTFDVRVLHMKNVVRLNGVDVSNADYSTHEVNIPSSTGGSYKVRVEGGVGVDCECKGFGFRRTCSHLKTAEELVK